jgi:hypothetical protein
MTDVTVCMVATEAVIGSKVDFAIFIVVRLIRGGGEVSVIGLGRS